MPIYTSHISSSAGAQISGSTEVHFGAMQAVGNASTISNDVTMPSNYNAFLYGPITIQNNASLTIGTESQVKIKDFDDV